MIVSIRQKSYKPDRHLYEYDILAGRMRVGLAQLRITPSKSPELPEGFENHVYYEIYNQYQNRGYATQALMSLIKLAKAHGEKTLTIVVNAKNLASKRVVEKCGGELKEKSNTINGKEVLRYEISI